MKRGLIVLSIACAGISIYLGVTELKSAIIRGTGNIDSIQIYKSKRQLLIFRKGEVDGEFRISLGSHPKGQKQFENDGKTPEGLYAIDGKNPMSDYHKNWGMSYPNQYDKYIARTLGKKAGGDIKIHGLMDKYKILGRLHRLHDWTAGCIAVTNDEIEYLYKNTAIGTPIRIFP